LQPLGLGLRIEGPNGGKHTATKSMGTTITNDGGAR